MLVFALSILFIGSNICSARPLAGRATTLDQAAIAEAQVRDNTATRAFSAAPIKVHLTPFPDFQVSEYSSFR